MKGGKGQQERSKKRQILWRAVDTWSYGAGKCLRVRAGGRGFRETPGTGGPERGSHGAGAAVWGLGACSAGRGREAD